MGAVAIIATQLEINGIYCIYYTNAHIKFYDFAAPRRQNQ